MNNMSEERKGFMISEVMKLYNKLSVSQQRLFDLMYPLGLEPLDEIDIESAFNVCQRTLKRGAQQ